MGFRNGSQICLGNDNCIRSTQIWAGVCTDLGRMMSFVMICGANPRSKLPNAIESATRDGYLLLASSEEELTTIIDNELKQQVSLIQDRGLLKSL